MAKKLKGYSEFDRDEFGRGLESIRMQLRRKAPLALRAASAILEGELHRNVPVDTGKTKGSIKVRAVRRSKRKFWQSVTVGSRKKEDAPVGHVEYGDMHHSPNPFFRKSVATSYGKMEAAIARILGSIE